MYASPASASPELPALPPSPVLLEKAARNRYSDMHGAHIVWVYLLLVSSGRLRLALAGAVLRRPARARPDPFSPGCCNPQRPVNHRKTQSALNYMGHLPKQPSQAYTGRSEERAWINDCRRSLTRCRRRVAPTSGARPARLVPALPCTAEPLGPTAGPSAWGMAQGNRSRNCHASRKHITGTAN